MLEQGGQYYMISHGGQSLIRYRLATSELVYIYMKKKHVCILFVPLLL